jgi:hypothetical protein
VARGHYPGFPNGTSRHPELGGDAITGLPRNVERISQEHLEIPDRRQLHPEPQTVVIPAPMTDHPQISVIQEEEPIQLPPRRRTDEPAIRLRLHIREELDRHHPNLPTTTTPAIRLKTP